MEIGAAQQSGLGQAGSSATKLADDFDTFLRLLTTQLQNQDPLEPLDSNEFTQQLVQFTGVEQAIATNQNLETLVALLVNQSETALVGYLGKDVTVATNQNVFDGSNPVKWNYDLGALSAETKLTIKDSNGLTVAEFPGNTAAGLHEFEWDGLNSNGQPVDEGTYSLSVEANTSEGTKIGHQIYIKDIVDGLERRHDGTFLSIGGGLISVGQVVAVSTREAAT